MNSKTLLLLVLAGTLTLFGCNYNQGVAQPQQQATTAPLVPQQSPKVVTQATPLTYKIENYHSQVLGASRTYGVSLPPNYEQNSQQRYPVIFLLHGGHKGPTDWFDKKGSALQTIQQLYATNKLPHSIIITPDGNDKRGSSPYFDPQYFDGPNGKISTAIGDELVKVVQNRYRTLFEREYIQETAKANADDVKDLQRQASTAKDPQVKAFVAQFLPVQQEHLKLASSLKTGNTATNATQSKMR